jgi:lipid A 3-O-deacylase
VIRLTKILVGGLFLVITTINTFSDQFSMYVENDFVHTTDKYYTHGTKLQYDRDDEYGMIFGQNIYTPLHKDISTPLTNERPYAGWLYIGLTVDKYTNNINDYYEFTIGIVGPHSYAEQTQKQIHRWLDNSLPQGWDNQLHDEFVANVYARKTFGYDIVVGLCDILPYGEASVGSVYDAVGVGSDIRFGYNIPKEFRPEVNVKNIQTGKIVFYVFSGINGRWVMHNIFLDGNNYRNSHNSVTVDKEPLVGEWRNGIVLGYGDIELRFTDFYRTKEYVLQDEATWNSSLSLAFRF